MHFARTNYQLPQWNHWYYQWQTPSCPPPTYSVWEEGTAQWTVCPSFRQSRPWRKQGLKDIKQDYPTLTLLLHHQKTLQYNKYPDRLGHHTPAHWLRPGRMLCKVFIMISNVFILKFVFILTCIQHSPSGWEHEAAPHSWRATLLHKPGCSHSPCTNQTQL